MRTLPLVCVFAVVAARATEIPAEQLRFFEEKVRPILVEHCYKCHSAEAEKLKGDLRLDTRAGWQKGGDSGQAAIVPGDSDASPLITAVRRTDKDTAMPPKTALEAAKVAVLETWVKMGAPDPRDEVPKMKNDAKSWWSFQRLAKPEPPSANGLPQTWTANPIDRFIFAKLAAQNLPPSPETDPRTLIRRVTYDLTGLPPTPEEVEDFVKAPDLPKLVDKLLASPRYGERWARHWLDVVRFAESHGFEMNRARPNAWPYRDYVIRAFNDDLPYDRFITEQLAGDAFGADDATGFLVAGSWDQVKGRDPMLNATQRADELHDLVSTTGSAFLGLTVGCARCHSHKFDPIPQTDYYAIKAVFEGVKHGERPMRPRDADERLAKADVLRKELAPLERKLASFQPKAQLARIIIVDDDATDSVTQIEQPKNGQPVVYSPGKERGQAGDPGDLARLPNLGESYRYWSAVNGQREDFFAWHPHTTGRFRVWLSWGAWTTHAKDARYVLDRDGDLQTTADQTELANVDQSKFADGTPAIAGQKRWSGFREAGVYELKPESCLVLRSGEKGGPTVADAVLFEEVGGNGQSLTASATAPSLRAPVSHRSNEEIFDAVEAKFVRFTITATSGSEPCIDEIEVFPASEPARNVALAKEGTEVTVSNVYANSMNGKHRREHINDGRFGNDFSWISRDKGIGWVQLAFAKPQRINRIVWGRDRGDARMTKVYEDRLPLGYQIEVSLDGNGWHAVASSLDRLPAEYRQRIKNVPTLSQPPLEQVAALSALNARRAEILGEINKLTSYPNIYAGKFETPGATFRLHRGDPMQPKEEVMSGALSEFGGGWRLAKDAPEQERRVALAKWIASPENPLTARVMVNRLWHYHFGRGLVDTPSDFGVNGGKPTHPELIDWLASEFVAHGWSMKAMHKLICTSATYRQASTAQAAAMKVDADSRLLWRFPPRRLEAEALRDSILAVTGKLDFKMGGAGFDLFEPNDNYVKVYVPLTEPGPETWRRMVYQAKPRMQLENVFGAFDAPDAGQVAPRRTSSTTPLQALNFLNSPFLLQQAKLFAERVEKEVGSETDAQVRRACLLAYGRVPPAEEEAAAVKFIAVEGLPAFCRALLNSSEFFYVF